MAHQTSRLTSFGSPVGSADDGYRNRDEGGPIQAVTSGASSVFNDAFDLAELQTRLLVADTKTCLSMAKSAIAGVVISLALLIASLPVVASGLAQGWLGGPLGLSGFAS